jgi:hypothetical protein
MLLGEAGVCSQCRMDRLYFDCLYELT